MSGRIEDGEPPLPQRNGGDISTQENEICPQSPTPEENQPVNAKSPHAQDAILQRDSVSDSPQLGPLHLLEKGGEILQLEDKY